MQKAQAEMALDMKKEERDQFRNMEKEYNDIQTYKFETQLRELVGECINPIRLLVYDNNEKLGSVQKDYEIQSDRINVLEVIYKNMSTDD